jgi:M6 family metalloprotease-like protein
MHSLLLKRPARRILAALAVFMLLTTGSVGQAFADDQTRGGPGVGPMVAGGRPVLGAQRFANILCKFQDVSTETTSIDGVKSLIGINSSGRTTTSAFPSVDHFWREASNGRMHLDGSKAFGWVVMAGKQKDYYLLDPVTRLPMPAFRDPDLYQQNFKKLAQDCVAAAEAQVLNPGAPNGINFDQFEGLNLFFNTELDGASGGMPLELTLDGDFRKLPVTWIASQQVQHYVLAHEMGHGFGLPHSSSPYDETYGSPYDLMSEGRDCYNYQDTDERRADYPMGCVALHPIAPYKAYLGWIPAARRFDVKPGPATTITLSRSAQPIVDSTNTIKWMAKLPIRGDARRYYTVELRLRQGYDAGVDDPGPDTDIFDNAVIIHKVDETLGDRNAKVVDADNNGNIGDLGSEWAPGETFTDAANGITVKVESFTVTAGTARVSVGITPLISINDLTVHEPAPAPPPSNDPEPEPDPSQFFSQARFTVRLAAAATVPVTVSYATVSGTAKVSVDYLRKEGSVTIPAGATSATIVVDVRRDNLPELPETFFVNLSNPVNGKILDSQAKGTIVDFD